MPDPSDPQRMKTMLMPAHPGGAASDDAHPMLVVVEGLEPGRRFVLQTNATTIGRGAENHVVLPSPAVSHAHARIAARDGQFFLEDLHSTNGVVVNGIALRAAEPRALGNGDAIRVSDHLLLFHHGGAQHASVATAIVVDHDDAARRADELLREIRAPR